MRITQSLLFVIILFWSHCTMAQQDSVKYYKSIVDSITKRSAREDSIKAAFLKQRTTRYKFKRLSWDVLGKIGIGFVTIDASKNEGLLTGSFEAAGKIQYHFKRHLSNGTVRTHPTSLYTTIGWGPTLVARETIPNFWYFNVGVQQNHFGSSTSYGLIAAVNSSGDEGNKFMYGVTVSLEGVATPVFLTYMLSDEGFSYIVLAGFKISVKQLIPTRSQLQP